MYVRFKVLKIETSLSQKTVTIESTHEIDPQTVTRANIRITQTGDTVEELIWETFAIEGKKIMITLIDDPFVNKPYLIRIKGLKNIIDESLETQYNQTICFIGANRSDLVILSPTLHSVVDQVHISYTDNYTDENVGYEIELSEDPVFGSLFLSTVSYQKEEWLDVSKTGQLYLRVRNFVTDELGNKLFSDWVNTTFSYKPAAMAGYSANPIFTKPLKILAYPSQNKLLNTLRFLFDCNELNPVSSDSVLVMHRSLDTSEVQNDLFTIKQDRNQLDICLNEVMDNNQIYTIHLKNISSGDHLLLENEVCEIYSQLSPCYTSISAIESTLGFECDAELILMHIHNASKLADYYAEIKLNSEYKNRRYYDKVENAMLFEKEQFVKYYVCKEVLLQTRTRLGVQSSTGGKLGEIEYSPKGSIPDLTSAFKYFIGEADKWKLALQGYKDYIPDPTSATKSLKCRPHDLHVRGRF